MIKKCQTGWRRIWNATVYSSKGFLAAWRNEAAFRQEVCLIFALIPVAFWVGTTMTQRALLIFSLLQILIVELLNSAVEATVDRIGAERHELSGLAKDLGSAAVMISLIVAVLIWALVAWETALG